jgi:hypothetical protein
MTMSGKSSANGSFADDIARAPNRVPEAVRRLLPGKAGRTGSRQHLLERHQLSGFAAFPQRRFELDLDVEMVFDHALVSAGDENEMLDPRCHRLLHDILHHRLVDHGKHLLRHGLGGGQKAGPQSGDRQNRLS